MKKIDQGTQFVSQHLNLFRCPVCHKALAAVENHSVVCQEGHRIDFSKYGTLNFLQRQIKSEYDQTMLSARKRLLQRGLFNGIFDGLSQYLPKSGLVVDVGSGEGTAVEYLNRLRPDLTWIGFDIATPGIRLATQLQTEAFFCMADLTNLPFASKQVAGLLNIFSPSAYAEFDEVLKPDGRLLKVVPANNYLMELRQGLYAGEDKADYDNTQVVAHFKDHYPTGQAIPIQYTFPLKGEKDWEDMMTMSPLAWQASDSQREKLLAANLTEITISVLLLYNL